MRWTEEWQMVKDKRNGYRSGSTVVEGKLMDGLNQKITVPVVFQWHISKVGIELTGYL